MKKFLILVGILCTLTLDVFAQQYNYRADRANGAMYNESTGQYDWGETQDTDVSISIYTDTNQMIIYSTTPQFFTLKGSLNYPIFPEYKSYTNSFVATDSNGVKCQVNFTRNSYGNCWIFIVYSNVVLAYRLEV